MIVKIYFQYYCNRMGRYLATASTPCPIIHSIVYKGVAILTIVLDQPWKIEKNIKPYIYQDILNNV